MFDQHPGTDEPEQIVALDDQRANLKGFIVLHSTALGPACGGTRFWSYPDTGSALLDAKRLAEGMSYKNALAGLPMGGGKAVVMRPPGAFDRARLFAALGAAVEALGGRYVTAEDVGTTVDDMGHVASRTAHVSGTRHDPIRPSGDPSPWTARGVFRSMQVAVERRFGRSLSGARVAVQGVGNVGFRLCQMLHDAGAELVVADPRDEVVRIAVDRFGARALPGTAIFSAECEVFAPCALGAILDPVSIPLLKAGVVCGGANNQLLTEEDGERLAARGIIYAPDYVVNAGGVINVAAEYLGWSNVDVAARADAIGKRLGEILAIAEAEGIATNIAAGRLARSVLRDGGQTRPSGRCL